MNMWGFPSPAFMDVLEMNFRRFFDETVPKNPQKAEYLLPTIVDGMLRGQKARVSVLPTDDRWFGVTYHEDIPSVKESFLELAREGVYPAKLWG